MNKRFAINSILLIITILTMLLSLTYLGYTESTAFEYLQEAQTLYQERGFIEAIDSFQKSLELNPYYKEAYKGLGKCYFELDNFGFAFNFFKQAYMLDKDDIDALLWIAKCKLAQNRLAGAELFIFIAIEKEPRNFQANLLYGNLMEKLGLYSIAQDYYKTAEEIDPHNFEVLIAQARSNIAAGNKLTAERLLKDAQQYNPGQLEPLITLAQFYYDDQNYASATVYLNRAINLAPDDEDAQILKVKINISRKQWDDALIAVNKLITHNQDSAELLYLKGMLLEQNNEFQDALFYMDQAIKNSDNNNLIYWSASTIALDNLSYQDEYRKELAQYYDEMSRFFLQENMLDKAYLLIRHGIRLNPKSFNLRKKLAGIFKSEELFCRYYNELNILNDLYPGNTEIEDELTYYERYQHRLYYKETEINDQYAVEPVFPKIAISMLTNNQEIDEPGVYYRANEIFTDMLVSSLYASDTLNVTEFTSPAESLSAREAKESGFDFLINGSITQSEERLLCNLNVINLHTGMNYATISLSRRGNTRFIDLALSLAERIEIIMPTAGMIILKQGDNSIVNLGTINGVDEESEFFILPSFNELIDILEYPLFKDNKELIESLAIGRIEIQNVDEKIAGGKISTFTIYDKVNTGNIVILNPESASASESEPEP